jgi:nitrite reductase/ring-hydroxylating ferredoxin subunit
MDPDNPADSQPAAAVVGTRRACLSKFLAIVIGGLVAAVPTLAGLAVFFDPVRRKLQGGEAGNAGDERFTTVATLDAVPADGLPRKFQVIADRVDAWTKHPASPVGAVYLKREKDTPDKVVAFNVVCPHAGCFVEPAAGGAFKCPCHNSLFNGDGSIVHGQCVSPRGLDEQEVDPAALMNGLVRIKFQNYLPGTPERKPLA